MKASNARLHYIIMLVASVVGASVFSAIAAFLIATPYAASGLKETIEDAMSKVDKEKHRTAVEEAKARKAALKKEQAKLAKDKKKLAKKKKKAMDKKVKRIYEERMANGYESSLDMIDKEALNMQAEVETTASKPKKATKKAKKATVNEPAIDPIAETKASLAAEPKSVFNDSNDDYTSNGSMFRGISF